jgi:hypothetical protein
MVHVLSFAIIVNQVLYLERPYFTLKYLSNEIFSAKKMKAHSPGLNGRLEL